VLHAEAYRHLFYGDAPLPSGHAVAFVQLERPMTALALALEKGIALQEFRFFNPDIKDLRRKLPRGFWVALPGENDSPRRLSRIARIPSRATKAEQTR